MGKLIFATVAGFVLSIIFLLAAPHVAPRLTQRIYCPEGTRIVTGSHTLYDPVARTNVTTHNTDCIDGEGRRVTQGFYGTIVSPFLTWFAPTFLILWLLSWWAGRAITTTSSSTVLTSHDAKAIAKEDELNVR